MRVDQNLKSREVIGTEVNLVSPSLAVDRATGNIKAGIIRNEISELHCPLDNFRVWSSGIRPGAMPHIAAVQYPSIYLQNKLRILNRYVRAA